MNWTLRLAAEQPPVAKAPPQPADIPAKARGSRPVYDPADQDMKDVSVYHRADLTIGSCVPGPAIIAEDETTTIVPKSFAARLTPDRRHPVGKGGIMSINDPLSPIRLQLMWDRLIAVVEEQALALMRTGFSTSTREAGDLSAGVFDLDGAMLAQAVTGTPGHINSMARAVYHFLDRFPAKTMKEGDIYLTNDPWKGTGHLHDFTFVTPTFRRGKMVALFASTCHVVDIGGRGMGADARQVYEEGLYIPLMHFAREGKVDQTLTDIVAANVREPVQVVGDLYSLATCNEIGCRRLIEMMDEFAIDDLDRLGAHILEKSKQASLEAIRKITPGEYKFSMTVDGYDKPIDLVATMKIGDTGIDVDFTGTSGVSAYGINVPVCYTEAYASFGVKCIVAPKVPNNEGSLEVIRVTAPEGSILNAKHPAPVAARHVTGQMLPDVMFGCLHQALKRRRAGRGHLVPVEPARRWAAPAGPTAIRPRRSNAKVVHHHELPCRRHRRAAGPRRPVGHRLPERRAQRAGRGQRDDLADRHLEEGIPPGFRRRGRVPRRPRPDHGSRHARRRALRDRGLLRPHRPSAARPRRRPERHGRAGGARVGPQAARHGPADRAEDREADHLDAGRRRSGQSAQAADRRSWPRTCARASSRPTPRAATTASRSTTTARSTRPRRRSCAPSRRSNRWRARHLQRRVFPLCNTP